MNVTAHEVYLEIAGKLKTSDEVRELRTYLNSLYYDLREEEDWIAIRQNIKH